MTPRGWAVLALVLLAAAVIVTAWLRVPWHDLAAPRSDQLAALRELPADGVAKGRAFHRDLRPATYGSMVVALVVALLLGLTPVGARLVALCGRPFGDSWLARAVLGGLAVVFASALITLPFAAWRRSVTVRYGLSTQGWGGWVVDLLKGFAVSAVLGAVALLGFYAITRYAPRWWWAFGAAGAAALVVLLSFVFPVLVEPIFNRFTPMAGGPLRTELMAMAARDGVPVRDVLVADASRRTRAVNAYVSGFGATRRIVVYDTLLEKASPGEVESVVAHELGHAKDGDVITGTVLGALGAGGAVIAVYLLGQWAGLLRRAGIDSIAEPRSIALLLAVAAVAGTLAGPVQNAVSRHIEARADAHALALTGDPGTFESMQAQLSLLNLGDPDPNRLEYLLFASHPSTVERMAAARAYGRGAR
ncbi:MAG TPA: M48 family metallopeptidase [Rugosimonospora sp.]|nr:M48 family metallopeptidase [Rugosimonospora sp.]